MARSAGDQEGQDRLLLEHVERLLRGKEAGTAYILHLSRLPAPAPRPHQRRVALVLLEDEARWSNGQVFALRDGDVALVSRRAPPPLGRAGGPKLPDTLLRLFRLDSPDPVQMLSVHALPRDGDIVLDGLRARLAHPGSARKPLPEIMASVRLIEEIETVIAKGPAAPLMQRQTAVLIRPGADRIQALYREITFSIAALEARIEGRLGVMPGHALADPYLFRHLATRLDRPMIEAVLRQIGTSGPLCAGPDGLALHLNLTPPGILAPGFARLATSCTQAGLRLGIEIALLDASADAAAFAKAASAVRGSKHALVLDGVTGETLPMVAPLLGPDDLVKLTWSPVLTSGGAGRDVTRVGPHRVVLHRAETEAAVTWGVAQGIERFQGRYVDAMLAAARLRGCASAPGCTLRQCVDRGGAASAVARAGCRNPGLLDAALPAVPA